ncbi:glycosyltransferase family A protein [Nocardioides lacusdianchii]|uniref:glycosyltransferase family A protein n=1 Tax=Nocardioides lacusdianchii TaxID=2783664 RepID=UPI001CCBF6D2|nr:glycosyltransferase family A protein [Nocardioides lacusdianchii]
MTETRVGIVIPSFNSGTMVAEAAASARECLGGVENIVIVDDGSTDRQSLKTLGSLQRTGFQVHRQENAGVSAARNYALTHLRTPYAIALDSDDLIEPGAASIAADVLDAHDDVVIVTGSGINFSDGASPQQSAPITPGALTREDMWRSTMIATASAFRLKDWHRVGGFPEGVAVGEDWVFWLRLLRGGGRISTSDAVFVRHRNHDAQITRGEIDPRESSKAANLVLRENVDLALAHSEDLIDELCRTRTTLAAYRHAYRRIDQAKVRLKSLGARLRRVQPRQS